VSGYDPAGYGDAVAREYDVLYPERELDTDATVALIAELARRRPTTSVLEFGIGTGRLALPLQRLGLDVAGIEISEAMLERLRRKPGGGELQVVLGDYVDTYVPGTFSVVVLAFNGIFDPRGRDAQLATFRNAASHLEPAGCFVVEAYVLSEAERSGQWTILPRHVARKHVELQLARYDQTTGNVARTLVHLRTTGVDFVTSQELYSTPDALDVMAEVAGFRLSDRWAGWTGEAFTSTSRKHVSIYERTHPR